MSAPLVLADKIHVRGRTTDRVQNVGPMGGISPQLADLYSPHEAEPAVPGHGRGRGFDDGDRALTGGDPFLHLDAQPDARGCSRRGWRQGHSGARILIIASPTLLIIGSLVRGI